MCHVQVTKYSRITYIRKHFLEGKVTRYCFYTAYLISVTVAAFLVYPETTHAGT